MKKSEVQTMRKAPGRFLRHAIPGILFFALLFVSWMRVPSPSMGEVGGNTEENVPLWWSDTHKRAVAGGYELLNLQELQALVQSEKEVVLLDVRPDYEYREGHMPGALNFEFHLGHRAGLEPESAKELKALLGKDRGRLIVTYCRSFR